MQRHLYDFVTIFTPRCYAERGSFWQWAAATCPAPPSVVAGQYATSINRHLQGNPESLTSSGLQLL